MQLKRDFIELAARDNSNIRELCRRFGVSAPTAYKWLKRYKEHGLAGLEERSRKPLSSPKKTPDELEKRIVEARHRHPAWGGRKIRRWLENQKIPAVPSVGTVTEVLRRHDLLAAPAGPSGTGWQRFERGAPNEQCHRHRGGLGRGVRHAAHRPSPVALG